MDVGSSPVAVTEIANIFRIARNYFIVIQATIEGGFILKRLLDMIRIYIQMHRLHKYSEHSSVNWPV